MNQSLPRSRRISRRGEIKRIFRRGLRAADETMRLIASRSSKSTENSRCGVIVSVKHGNAVRRNRIKRLCREAFRLASSRMPGAMDYLICPHTRTVSDLVSLIESLETLSRRISETQDRKILNRNRSEGV